MPDMVNYGLSEIHNTLSHYWNIIHEISGDDDDVNLMTCLTILEEDIHDLLLECEERLMAENMVWDEDVEDLSLELRSATVLDEVSKILRK